jgi:hypothetical protein
MNVSYSMVRWHYSDISSTALGQHSGFWNRLSPKDGPPSLEKSGLEQSIMPVNSRNF